MILVKLTSRSYADSVLSGRLYMNPLSYFWENGTEQQADIFEGTAGIEGAREIEKILPNAFGGALARNVRLQAAGYAYCNVFCMTTIEAVPLGKDVMIRAPRGLGGLGDVAVVIRDKDEFFRRVGRAVDKAGFHFVGDRIRYQRPTLNKEAARSPSHVTFRSVEAVGLSILDVWNSDRPTDSFCKHYKYGGQREWRISLCRHVTTSEPYVLDVGDLHDIAFATDAGLLEDMGCVEKLVIDLLPGSLDYRLTIGNVSRGELRKMFVDLGKGEYHLLFSL